MKRNEIVKKGLLGLLIAPMLWPVALVWLLSVGVMMSACTHTLPKPTNANGSFNPSVAVADAKITTTNLVNDAATYAETCHRTTPAPIGCDERVIAQLKIAGPKAMDAVNAAENAVRTLPAGASGIDAAIARMNAAITFLQSLLSTAKHPPTGMLQNLHILEGVIA